ncbi:MAG: hypothetical protein ABSE28_22825, partial [Candidatus Sulfotelmatobacter sp.]
QAEAHVLLSGLVLSIPIEVVGKQEVNRGILRRLILSVQKRAHGKRRQISNEKSACVQLWGKWRTAASWDEP